MAPEEEAALSSRGRKGPNHSGSTRLKAHAGEDQKVGWHTMTLPPQSRHLCLQWGIPSSLRSLGTTFPQIPFGMRDPHATPWAPLCHRSKRLGPEERTCKIVFSPYLWCLPAQNEHRHLTAAGVKAGAQEPQVSSGSLLLEPLLSLSLPRFLLSSPSHLPLWILILPTLSEPSGSTQCLPFSYQPLSLIVTCSQEFSLPLSFPAPQTLPPEVPASLACSCRSRLCSHLPLLQDQRPSLAPRDPGLLIHPGLGMRGQ